MISETEKYQGIVLRQLLAIQSRPLRIGNADLQGRLDAFCVEDAAFQIKFSSKRLSPWRFTYLRENIDELTGLSRSFNPVWLFLVCGSDGVVGLSMQEFLSIIEIGDGGAAWLRVNRSRNSMYRVGGALGDLPSAKPRGLQPFLTEVLNGKGV
jgi:hypothetical protein